MASYPHGRDYAWLAIDAVGHVAVFTNAGEGPIPVSVLVDRDQADQAEKWIGELPEPGGCRLLVTLPRPDDFIAFAWRGLFAYDWRDALRTEEPTFRYELLALPESPIVVHELEPRVASLARKVQFASLRFADERRVAVGELVECR